MSCDGQIFVMDELAAIQSEILNHLIEDSCANDIIPLPNVTGETLSLVIEYCNKHAKFATTTHENDHKLFDENLKTWDAQFMNVDQRIIYNLLMVSFLFYPIWSLFSEDLCHDISSIINMCLLFDFQAANYLNIKSLLDLVCQTVADMIKNKSPQQIREIFNIKNDFTPEEEEAIRKENEWAFNNF